MNAKGSMVLFLLSANLGWIQGQFNFTELSLRYPTLHSFEHRGGVFFPYNGLRNLIYNKVKFHSIGKVLIIEKIKYSDLIMKVCPRCDGLNNDDDEYCYYCANRIQSSFSIKFFIKDNFQLFTVLGVFWAIAYYLSSYAQTLNKNQFTFSGQISGNANQMDSFSGFINGSVDSVSGVTASLFIDSIFGIPIHLINLLQYGAIICYLIFFVIIIILIREVGTRHINTQGYMCLFALIALFAISIGYLFLTYYQAIPSFIAIIVAYLVFTRFIEADRYISKRGQESGKYSSLPLFVMLIASSALLALLPVLILLEIFLFSNSALNIPFFIQEVILSATIGWLFGTILGVIFFEIHFVVDFVLTRPENTRRIKYAGISFSVVGLVSTYYLMIYAPQWQNVGYGLLLVGILCILNLIIPFLAKRLRHSLL